MRVMGAEPVGLNISSCYTFGLREKALKLKGPKKAGMSVQ